MYQVVIESETSKLNKSPFKIYRYANGNPCTDPWDYLDEWCKEYIKGYYKCTYSNDIICDMWFENEEDAVAFKLMWA